MLLRVPTDYVFRTLTNAEHRIVHHLASSGHPVHAIRFLHEQYNLGLKDAKYLYDTAIAAPLLIP